MTDAVNFTPSVEFKVFKRKFKIRFSGSDKFLQS